MKKAIVVLLLLVTLLVGCADQNEGADSSTVPGTSASASSYSDITCYSASNHDVFLVGSPTDADVLSLRLPSTWVLTKRGSSFVISNERGEIGAIVPGADPNAAKWEAACEEEHKSLSTVSVAKIVEKRIGGSDFRHRFTYTYRSNGRTRTITLTVNYAEADSFSQDFIYGGAKTKQVRTDPQIGLVSAASAKKSVLILGNSFIGTSKIGGILQEMCNQNGKNCTVTAYSRGYANIGTYATDSSVVDSIKAKTFGAVFLCGCYNSDAEIVSHYATIRSACETAGIPLILFPAHNENTDTIFQVRDKYPNDLYLNWREEIDNLIYEQGIDFWDFCVNDQHKHSTPLAGYVGAHMIYRAIFGEIPSKYQSSVFDSTSYYRTLGDYVTNPAILIAGKATVYFFK